MFGSNPFKTLVLFLYLFLTVILCSCATDPIANPGEDQTIELGQTATLSGVESDKTSGSKLTYLWRIVSAPVGSTAALSSKTDAEPTFKPDKAGEYVFELVVSNHWDSEPETVTIICIDIPIDNDDLLIDVTTKQISQSDTHVTFSVILSMTNLTASRLNVSIPITAKDGIGGTVFTKTNIYSINSGETIQSTTEYPDALSIALYNSITEWSIGTITKSP